MIQKYQNRIAFVIATFVFLSLVFLSCEKEEIPDKNHPEYIELSSYNLTDMSEWDMQQIGKALQRLDINKKDGLYFIEQSCGTEVNISEELFEYISKGFEHTNKIFRPRPLNSSIPRLKSGSTEGDDTEQNDATDCVAHALDGMGEITYEVAQEWIEENYGQGGVPSTAIDSVVNHFYPNATSSTTPSPGHMTNAFIYFPNSDSTGHAANGFWYDDDSGYIYYEDGQGGSGIVTPDSCYNIYYP